MTERSSAASAVTVTILAQGDNENTPAEAVHHALEYARKAGFIESWTDPVALAQEVPIAVSQHIGWLKQYVEGMTADNWQDMRLQAERQLAELAKALALASPPCGTPESL